MGSGCEFGLDCFGATDACEALIRADGSEALELIVNMAEIELH
jgi:hypothetical protein